MQQQNSAPLRAREGGAKLRRAYGSVNLLAKLRVSLLSRYLGSDDLLSYRMEARRRRKKAAN